MRTWQGLQYSTSSESGGDVRAQQRKSRACRAEMILSKPLWGCDPWQLYDKSVDQVNQEEKRHVRNNPLHW